MYNFQKKILLLISVILLTLNSCAYQQKECKDGSVQVNISENTAYELSGEWEFYKNVFLNYGDFTSQQAEDNRKIIAFDTPWSSSIISDDKTNPYGYGTYRLKIKLDSPMPDMVFFRIPYFTAAVDIFVNDKKIHSSGKTGKNIDESAPEICHPVIIAVPMQNSSFEVIMHVSNFHYPYTSMRQKFIIGSRSALMNLNYALISIEMLFLGILLITIIHNIIIRIKAGRDPLSSCFIILCIFSLILTTVNGSNLLGRMGMPWETLFDVHYISWTIILFILYMYTSEFLTEYSHPCVTIFLSGLVIVIILSVILLPLRIYSKLFIWDTFISAGIFLYIIYLSIKGIIHRKNDSIPFLLSVTIFIAILTNDIFFYFPIDQYNLTLPAGLIFFSIFQSYLIGGKIKRNMIELEEKNDILTFQSRHAMMGERIDYIAHQWKQELYAISLYINGMTNIIKNRFSESRDISLSTLTSMSKGLDSMEKTLEDFRSFLSPVTLKEKFEINSAINDVINTTAGDYSIHRISLEKINTGELYVNGYANEFKQVILNILINARASIVRLKPPEPMVSIETRKDNDRIIIIISNNGERLSKKFKEKIFEKYYTTKINSSGLGLYISRMIIKNHFNGKIWADSDKDKTYFYINIPVNL